jgi:predicted PurR-regulated permease PerM
MRIANKYLLDFFQSFLSELPTLFILLIIMIICTFSFLKHASSIRVTFQKLFGFSDRKMDQLVKIFINDSRDVYMSNIITGAIQSLIVATAVSLLGLADFFLVFFITLVLSFIPVIGAAPVAFVFAALAFFTGNNTAAIVLVVVSVFAGVIDNILRPWLATFGESNIPPVFAFICVIGGALWLGFPGLFIGLLVGSYAYDTLPIFWDDL